MAFQMPLDKLKKLLSFKETRSRQEEESGKKQRSGGVLCCISEPKQSLLSCHLEIGLSLLTPSL
jgi:hypothetical protein